MRLSCADHVSKKAASTYVRNSRMRVPSARYVSQSRIASLKGISLMSKQFTHLHVGTRPSKVIVPHSRARPLSSFQQSSDAQANNLWALCKECMWVTC